ncbi:amino acid permease [Kocuria coralli]|uniref:Amino acid permease n=1 Tax=Kocuria coralli TaxID=1461025 RepID=A0A5J5KZP4_9MICC|nr:amino acid permease [Kocuria coralli]KAA9394395.1 amino acid permease [Kocuria coralli]
MTMIAMGGAIGTGLFVASGNSIATAGPGGALAAYVAIGLMVYLLMQSLGEMSAWRPTSGSFGDHAGRYVSSSFGFAIGWNYWFNWAITLAAELVAAALVMRYWFPDSPSWLWSALFLLIVFGLNALSTRAYGEGEFWLAAIKVAAVVVFLALGVLMILGILGGENPGFTNWTAGEAPFVGGPITVLAIFMVAGFSFQGTELVGVAAGEAKDPETTVPKAIRTVFFRILLFYVGAITVIGFLLPYNNPHLLASDIQDVAMSPFTLVLQNAGVAFAASVMNAVILTAILSAGNSGLYASTRMLWSLAMEGKAPRFLRKLNKRGVPMYALLITSAFGLLAFGTTWFGDGAVYTWLINASALAGFIVWAGIAWTHYNFRKAFKAQGRSVSELPFRAKFFPAGPVVALAMCLLVIVGQSYEAFINGTITPLSLLSSYLGLPLFLAFWWGHKLVTKSQRVQPAQADLSRNRDDEAA